MAYSTRRPGGGWSRVSSGTDYSSVVSNYAVAFQQALQAQAQTELESKVFNYKNGTLSYTDLKKFLNDKLMTELPGSQKELDLRQLVMDLDTFETTKNRDLERSKLEAKYSKNGISAGERLTIETEILKFFKQGTPEYAEQLSTIAATKELQRQEAKNERIAELEGKLSDGGLSTEEQIQIMEQARSLSERGTQEYSGYTSKIGLLKEQKQEEDLAKRRNEAVSGLLDKYASGGLTNEELLEINRTEQQFTAKDSEDYIKLKESEADILGAINSEGSGSAQREAEEQAAIRYATNAKGLASLQAKFDRGEITVQDYLNRKESIFRLMESDVEAGDISPGDQADLIQRMNEFLEQKNKIESGTGVVINDGTNRVIVDRASAGRLKGTQVGKAYFMDDEKNLVLKDETGKDAGKEVSVLKALDPETGLEKDYFVNENGELEEASFQELDDKSVVVVRTGKIMKSTKAQGEPVLQSRMKSGPTVVKPTLSKAPPGSTNPFSTQSRASSSSKPTQSKNSSSSKSTSKKTSSYSSPQVVKDAYNAVKKATTTGTSYNTAKPIAKIGNTKVTKGNIKGTVDFGITEKVSSATKKLTSKISSLFKKR